MAETTSTGEDAPKLSRPTLKYMAKRVIAEFTRQRHRSGREAHLHFDSLHRSHAAGAVLAGDLLLARGSRTRSRDCWWTSSAKSAAGDAELGAEDAIENRP